MKTPQISKALIGSLILAVCLVNYGGGGAKAANSASSSYNSSYMLSWDVPLRTVNNKTINPYEDLYQYELYVSATASFSDSDTPVAFVFAVEENLSKDGTVSKKLISEFDLAFLNLNDSSSTLYVSLRVVGFDSQKSGFMEPVTWPRSKNLKK